MGDQMICSTPISGNAFNAAVDGWILITDGAIKTAKTDNQYFSYSGLDATALRVNGSYFPPMGQPVSKYDIGTVVRIVGSVGEGQNGTFVKTKLIVPVTDAADISEFKQICYPAVPKERLSRIIADLRAYSTSFGSDPGLQALSDALWSYFEPFLPIMPAAKKNHEPLRGGLALHSWEVTTFLNSQFIFDLGMDRNILIFSAMYHDIGKTREYTEDLDWAIDGRLRSHADIAVELIYRCIVTDNIIIDDKTLRQILHCIMSHHGEWGAVKPVTKEALALHHADNMLAKIGNIAETVRQGLIGNDGWGPWTRVLDSQSYVPELDDRQ